jgi:actin-related protein
MDTRKQLYNSIVISGANTMFPGFSSRLEAEIKNSYKQKILNNDSTREIKIKIDIIDTPRRKYSVFLGACFLANFYAMNENYWMTKSDWEEIGPNLIEKKCQNILY